MQYPAKGASGSFMVCLLGGAHNENGVAGFGGSPTGRTGGNAHRSGARAWDPATKRAYANDLTDSEHLIAVTDNVNQSKRDKGATRMETALRRRLVHLLTGDRRSTKWDDGECAW
jgi:hypothetical protein